jgi:hypothetical protein
VQQAHATSTRRPTAEITANMADVMRRREAASGACTEADLQAAGFSAFEIAAYSGNASALARRLALRVIQSNPREPEPDHVEPPVLAATPSSRRFYADAMFGSLRTLRNVPQTREGCRDQLKHFGFPEEMIEPCLEEVYGRLHPHACDLGQVRSRTLIAAADAYALPLARGAR